MKPISIALIGAVLTLGACDQVKNDPDIQEATTAVKGAIKDDGAALKAVRDAQRAREAKPEEQNTEESQGESPAP